MELFAVLDVQELPEEVPYFDVVVDAQTWGERRGENELAVGGPLTACEVLDASIVNILVSSLVMVIDIDLCEIADVTIDRS